MSEWLPASEESPPTAAAVQAPVQQSEWRVPAAPEAPPEGSPDANSWTIAATPAAPAAPVDTGATAQWLAPSAAHPAAVSPEEAARVSERGERAVSGLFTELAGRAAAAPLTAEAMAAFSRPTRTGEHSERALRSLALTIAAEHGLVGPPRTGWRAAVRRSSDERNCAATATLLAAQVGGELNESDARALDAHLARCSSCRAAQLRWIRAARVFDAIMLFGSAAELTEAAPAPAAVQPEEEPATESWAPAAAAAAPAAVTTSTWVAPAGAAATAVGPPKHERRPRRNRLLLLAGALLAVVVAAVAVALINHKSTSTPPARASVPAAPVHHAAATHARHHARVVKHHTVVHHKAVVHHKTAPASTAAASTAAAPVYTPPATSAPVTPAPSTPAPSTPPSSSGSSGSSGSAGGSGATTLTQGSGGGSLPPATAPTSTVGSGK